MVLCGGRRRAEAPRAHCVGALGLLRPGGAETGNASVSIVAHERETLGDPTSVALVARALARRARSGHDPGGPAGAAAGAPCGRRQWGQIWDILRPATGPRRPLPKPRRPRTPLVSSRRPRAAAAASRGRAVCVLTPADTCHSQSGHCQRRLAPACRALSRSARAQSPILRRSSSAETVAELSKGRGSDGSDPLPDAWQSGGLVSPPKLKSACAAFHRLSHAGSGVPTAAIATA